MHTTSGIHAGLNEWLHMLYVVSFGSVVFYIHGFGWYVHPKLRHRIFWDTPSWSQAKLYTLINKGRETLCVGVGGVCVWVCGVWMCGVLGVWCVNGEGNQNKEYGSLLTLPTKSTFLPLTMHIPLSCALISPSLPRPLLLSPISTPPTVNNDPAWMTLVSLVLCSSTSR